MSLFTQHNTRDVSGNTTGETDVTAAAWTNLRNCTCMQNFLQRVDDLCWVLVDELKRFRVFTVQILKLPQCKWWTSFYFQFRLLLWFNVKTVKVRLMFPAELRSAECVCSTERPILSWLRHSWSVCVCETQTRLPCCCCGILQDNMNSVSKCFVLSVRTENTSVLNKFTS